ncbi:MAG: hypothetical protein JXQ73_29760 [Phycisphaerae bacterium]|nr:hypothetical protein [Phycisphaerae bacterium]
MSSHEQAVFLLRLVINVAPVAVYFLALGLVNTQARPRLVSGRSDFIALTLVFVPVLVWPVPLLIKYQLWWVVVAALCLGGAVFWWLLPQRLSNWVVYNITERRCRRMLSEALARMGLAATEDEQGLTVTSANLRIDLAGFGLLNNVTLYFSPLHGKHLDAARLHRLRAELDDRLNTVSLLPSPTGACLVMLGVGLLIVPLWMMSQHMNAIVEIFTRLLSA